MTAWREYILSIVTVSLGCGIVLQIIPTSGKKELLRIICGVILTVSILRPLSRIRMDDFPEIPQLETKSAEQYLSIGENTAANLKKQYITQACETYILNKAKAFGEEISPVITLDGEYAPVFAEIQGTVDPQVRLDLENVLIFDMGITKENQRWIGNPESSG